MAGANKRKPNPEFERQQFINFFEELSWLLETNKDVNFKRHPSSYGSIEISPCMEQSLAELQIMPMI